jgi:hypothetical protein
LERALGLKTDVLAGVEQVLPAAADRDKALVSNLETVSLRDVSRARNQIRTLVGGEIILAPTHEGGLNAQMQGDYAGLIALTKAPGKISVVAGEGLEPPTRGL